MSALSERELTAVRLLCAGETRKIAAISMGVTTQSMDTYLRRARVKYEAETNVQLAFLIGQEIAADAMLEALRSRAAADDKDSREGRTHSYGKGDGVLVFIPDDEAEA